MAIYRGSGGSVEGIIESDIVTVAITQGGTGAKTAAAARTNLGLGTAATTDSSAYATAAQGTLADSAVQPTDIGTAAAKDITFFASAAQGTLADSALQSDDIGVSVQAYDAQLTDVAGLTATDNGVIIGNGTNFVVESGSTLRSSLGLAIGTDVLAPNGSAASLTDFPTFNQNTTGTAANVSGVVAIANGGTGQTTAATARAALLPTYATNGGKVLAVKADASDVEYITVSGSGSVTSVDMSVPTGLSVSGNPVTSAGTLAVTYASGYAIPTTAKQTEWDTAYTDRNKWDGGATGLTAATGRTSLGLGTAATTAATDYATAAQGVKADDALPATNPSYTGTLTGGTGVVNLGSGQLYKDSSGNVGVGTSSPGQKLTVVGTIESTSGGVKFPDGTTQATAASSVPIDIQTFNAGDADLTWDKPTGGQTMVKIQVWAGGGGGSRGGSATNGFGGGGGGAYIEWSGPISYMASTATVTVGAAGVGRTSSTGNGTAGGNSSVVIASYPSGSLTLTAYGGGGAVGGAGSSSGSGGGGGGQGTAGVNGAAGKGFISETGYGIDVGNGGTGSSGSVSANDGMGSYYGGAGGVGVGFTIKGGNSVWGGGGGAKTTAVNGSATGETRCQSLSLFGGNGGVGAAGTTPAGGGGCASTTNTNAFDGGAGRVIITSW